jgi:hypothetical protein
MRTTSSQRQTLRPMSIRSNWRSITIIITITTTTTIIIITITIIIITTITTTTTDGRPGADDGAGLSRLV